MRPDTDNWQRLQELFHLAEGIPEAEREVFLESVCSNAELRRRVMALLRGNDVVEAAQAAPARTANAAPLGTVGPYTLIKSLGAGGMGAVYLVERDASGIRQRAALKMLGAHAAGASFVERFHREQRILASMDHPNITRMLDAGVSDTGQPYLVMEYVEGRALDAYCDAGKLNVEARLRLFLKVCEAVDYAHRNLVVHLDLKPSNILVTADGTPKLLDFGTSKLLHADGEFTTTISATPSYASPEQLRNEAVTTACDVYSLGVILFELLSGKRPSGDASLAVLIERAMGERGPDRPEQAVTPAAAERRGITEARLRALLAGDLTTILRKCLNAAPLERYASVNALAGDIERYLEGRPVLAQPQTVIYRMKKFVRRHRGKVAVSAMMLLALVASLGFAMWRQEQAIRDGQRAQRMQTFMYRAFKMANSNFTGKPVTTMKDFLRMGITILPEYIKNPGDLRQAQLSFAESMFWNHDYDDAQPVWAKVIETAQAAGDVAAEAEAQSWSGYVSHLQGHSNVALARTKTGLELSRKPGVPARTRAYSAVFYATTREDMGQYTDENLELYKFAVKVERDNGLPPHEIGEALYYVGGGLMLRGHLEEAIQTLQETMDIYAQDPIAVCDEANVLGLMADVRRYQGRSADAIPLGRKAYETSLRCHGPEDPETIRFHGFLALVLIDTGQAAEGLAMVEQDLPVVRKIFQGNALYLDEILSILVRGYLADHRFNDAERTAREDLQIIAGQFPPEDRRLASMHVWLGRALAGEGRYAEGLAELEAGAPMLAKTASTALQKANVEKLRAEMDDVRAKANASKKPKTR